MANTFQKQLNEFLKRRGLQPVQGDKFPFFDIRKTLYGQMGQADTFIGSEQQNASVLQGLQGAEKNVGVKITPDNVTDIARQQAFTKAGITAPIGSPEATQQLLARGQELIAPPRESGGLFPPPPQPELPELPGEAVTGIEPTDLLPEPAPTIELPGIPTGEELASMALEQIQTGAAFPLQLEAQQAAKSAIQLQAQQETQDFIRNIASRGLFFSGETAKGIQRIEVDKLADLLNIDRSFALLMVQGLEQSAQQIAKDAAKGRQEAIDALEMLGYGINPLTGKVEPTLQARKAIATEERAERRALETQVRFEETQAATQARFKAQQELREAQYQLSIAKTDAQLKQAQQKIDISEEHLRIAQAKVGKLGVTGADYNTRLNAEITALYSGRYGKEGSREQIISSLQAEFPQMDVAADVYRRVPDGYEAQIKAVGEPALAKWELEGTVWQWLETEEAKALSDEEKASQIRSYGLDPATFGIY